MVARSPVLPFAAACLGIALYSVMDTLMKRLAIDSGAHAAVMWRSMAGMALLAPVFALRGQRWPHAARLRLHLARGTAAGVSVIAIGERVSEWTVAGAALIVAGCGLAVRRPPAPVIMVEAGA